MIWWVIGTYLLIFLILIPFRVKSKLSYNLGKNEGKLSVMVVKLKVYKEEFSLRYNAIIIKGKKGDKKTNFNQFGKTGVGDIFALNLIKSIKINTIKSDIIVGAYKPHITAYIAGVLLAAQKIVLPILSNKKDITVLRGVVQPDYSGNKLDIRFSFSITLNLFIIIVCFIKALFRVEKGVKIYGRQSS